MKEKVKEKKLLAKIRDLESRLAESDHLIEAIKAGEVDAFAIINNHKSEVFTLQSGDFAYRVLVEEFAEGAINVTEDGLIVYTNSYFCNLLKLSYEKVVGSTIFDFVHDDSKMLFRSLFKKAQSGKSKGEISLVLNKKVIPVYISLTSLKPTLATIGIVITDLTEKKRNEKIIFEFQKDLESKNQELVKSNEELGAFVYIASHDLQEPLRKIQTFSSAILEKDFEALSANGKKYFSRMQLSAKRMQALIEDVLAYSRTSNVEKNFVNTDLHLIVNDVKSALKDELKQTKAVIEAANLGQAKIIPFQFRQLMYNLLSNSLKFSHSNRQPLIQIKSETVKGKELKNKKLEKEIEYCHISVSDNGIGFEQQFSEKIFELFQRLRSQSEYKGTGIGLAIVKKIVENHKGLITARSRLDQGATFDIYIPAS